MAFFLTAIYLVLSSLSPAELFPEIAAARPMLIITGIALAFSIVSLMTNLSLLKSEQLWLLLAFYGLVVTSAPLHGWMGGGVIALQGFLPQFFTFVVVLFCCTGIWKVRWLGYTFIITGIVYSVLGMMALYGNYRQDTFIIMDYSARDAITGLDARDLSRVRGVGFLADPNDLAQNLLLALPFLGLLWKRRNIVWNAAAVILPGALILFCFEKTGSRGGLLALLAMSAFALRQRFKTIGPLLSVAFGIVLIVVLGFGGGRGVSVGSGTGGSRLELWSDALGLFKTYPFTGVGFGSVLDYMVMTTHNSFLLALVELGALGALVWVGMVVVSFLQLYAIRKCPDCSQELKRLSRAMQLCWISFATAALFVSRTYIITFYALLGMTAGLWYLARRETPTLDAVSQKSFLGTTVATFVGLILMAYVLVRMRWAS